MLGALECWGQARRSGREEDGKRGWRPKNPPKLQKYQKKTGFTRTCSKSSCELLPSGLWHESGTQWQLFRKTRSDELFVILGACLGGLSSSERGRVTPLLEQGKTVEGRNSRTMGKERGEGLGEEVEAFGAGGRVDGDKS